MGTAVADPHAYLEDANDPRTRAWTEEHNRRARATLDAAPGRAKLIERLDELLAIGIVGVPHERGERLFYVARRELQEQFVLYVREGGIDRVLIDPSVLDPSGLTALDWWFPSPHGTYVAYGVSRNGDERSTLHVLDVARAASFGETIPYTRHCSLAWLRDERGFYYTRFPADSDYSPRIYLHALGADWMDDPLVFGEGRAPEDMLTVELSANGRWLVVGVHRGWTANDVFIADQRSDAPRRLHPVVTGRDALYSARVRGDELIVVTNEGAPRYRVAIAHAGDPAPDRWRDLVKEDPQATLHEIAFARDGILLSYVEDVGSFLRYRLDDGTMLDIGASELSARNEKITVAALSSEEDSRDAYALVTGFLSAPRVLRLRAEHGRVGTTTWDEVAVPFDPARYRVEQRWFRSKDGTRVPMFVIASNGTPFDGSAPAVLDGYGGFNQSLTPEFKPSIVPWLDAGGIYAVANIRGGGEFGEDWHRAGIRERKQNVFDDFIAAAEYLASESITDPSRIGIVGGSNGGLLVTACETQRPELYRAVVSAVPLTDMLRFHKFLIARLWIDEFGDPDDPNDAVFLRAYSPYHNVREGVEYPATFLTTAESDSRVDPMHARKFGARLEEATAGNAPVLVFVEPHAGHGIGKPRAKQVEEIADRWSFLATHLNVKFT